MSATTFATYPASSLNTAQTAPASTGAHDALSVEQSYKAAMTTPTFGVAAPAMGGSTASAHAAPGPGLTTLALGEEDGGMAMAPELSPPAPPAADGGYQVTTLAIGEEDGGGAVAQYDAHATIGSDYASLPNAARPTGMESNYGTMQPIYSPGEPEYPAFAKTSQTPDLLNFHPVARIPKTVIVQTTPVMTQAPAIMAPVTNQPMVMATAPVGTLPQPVTQTAGFESVGSYDDYVQSLGGGTAAPAPTPAPTYEPFVPSYEQTAPAPSPYTAPVMSAEPMQKPHSAPAPNAAFAPSTEATYVTVPIDAYLVPPQGATPTPPTASYGADAPVTKDQPMPDVSIPETSMPEASTPEEPTPSMGGSFVVIDTALPSALTTPAASGLDVMTLAIGEEAGAQ